MVWVFRAARKKFPIQKNIGRWATSITRFQLDDGLFRAFREKKVMVDFFFVGANGLSDLSKLKSKSKRHLGGWHHEKWFARYLAILRVCDLIGMVKWPVTLLNGCWWPSTIGDKKVTIRLVVRVTFSLTIPKRSPACRTARYLLNASHSDFFVHYLGLPGKTFP